MHQWNIKKYLKNSEREIRTTTNFSRRAICQFIIIINFDCCIFIYVKTENRSCDNIQYIFVRDTFPKCVRTENLLCTWLRVISTSTAVAVADVFVCSYKNKKKTCVCFYSLLLLLSSIGIQDKKYCAWFLKLNAKTEKYKIRSKKLFNFALVLFVYLVWVSCNYRSFSLSIYSINRLSYVLKFHLYDIWILERNSTLHKILRKSYVRYSGTTYSCAVHYMETSNKQTINILHGITKQKPNPKYWIIYGSNIFGEWLHTYLRNQRRKQK